MKVNWPLYLVKFMRHKDVNATTKVSHFDVLPIAVSKAEAANLWVMLQRNEYISCSTEWRDGSSKVMTIVNQKKVNNIMANDNSK